MSEEPAFEPPPLFRLSTAVYAQRDGKILILKRAVGEVTGGWYLPGGAVDAGDATLEDAACRELVEESGLKPSGALTIVGAFFMHVYGHPTLQVTFAADCADGDVVLSHEHSAFRWTDAADYRDRYFAEDTIASVAERDERIAGIMRGIRANLDAYIRWRHAR
jgi:8-oxo-dGTP diphosphatase